MAAPTALPAHERTDPERFFTASWLRDLEEADDADEPDPYDSGEYADDPDDESAAAEDPEDSDELVEDGDPDELDGCHGSAATAPFPRSRQERVAVSHSPFPPPELSSGSLRS